MSNLAPAARPAEHPNEGPNASLTRHPPWVGQIGSDCPGERGPRACFGRHGQKPVCASAASPGEAPLLVVG